MKELEDNDGNLLDNNDAINEYVLKHFTNTFKGPEPGFDIDSFNDFCKKYNVNLPTIDAELANSLKEPINKHSISSAISNLKNSSAGGPDGISSLLLKDLNKKIPHIVKKCFCQRYK